MEKAKEQLSYGKTYLIQNGYSGWSDNYLITNGYRCEDNLMCVSTSMSFNRAAGRENWKVLSATGKTVGEAVLSGDQVYLQNQFDSGNASAGGYLDTRGTGCEGNLLCVSTSASFNRYAGSGTWRIIKETSGGPVQEDDVVHLWNGASEWTGGFLDTRVAGCQGNLYCVSSCGSWNRDAGSTHWRFQKQ